MKSIAFVLTLTFTTSAFAGDFLSNTDSLFRNQNLCDADVDQVAAEAKYKEMFEILKAEIAKDKKKLSVEAPIISRYSSILKDVATKQECQLVEHDDCYSVSCN